MGTGAATNALDDIERAHTILVAGVNPTEGHPVTGARIKQAARHGANLIVIDPRHIELCDFATLHLQLHPGTNVVLFNAIGAAMSKWAKLRKAIPTYEKSLRPSRHAAIITRWHLPQ
mgnify:CR=1 FL=1